jgi:hypothetical protein
MPKARLFAAFDFSPALGHNLDLLQERECKRPAFSG